MTFPDWLSILAIACLGAMSPGPSLAVVLKQTVTNGRGHGLAASWFHAAGVGLWAVATIAGLAAIVQQSEEIFTVITWGGALYLAWIGISAIRAGASNPVAVEKAERVSFWRAGVEGAMISILNPKLAVFFIALFSQFIARDGNFTGHAIMVATVTLVDGLWYSLVAVFLSHGPIQGALQKRGLLINRLTGVVLLLLAIRVVTL
ncbi:LysE family translocator [Rhodovibrionaceae bacterium A322]